jgi:hypothetical protein
LDKKYQKRLGLGSPDLRRGSPARASSAARFFSLAIAQRTLQRPAVRIPTRAQEETLTIEIVLYIERSSALFHNIVAAISNFGSAIYLYE